MKLTVVGAGYVGLVSGACLADFGHTVVCVDTDAARVELLRSGGIPIFEPGLDTLVRRNAAAGRLSFTTDLPAAMDGADAVFVAVGTPTRRGDGHADLQYVFSATRDIAAAISDYTVVVTKSTVPVGTGDAIEALLLETLDASQFDVVSNPEFLREGAAIEDFKRPDRIVVGTTSPRARAVMEAVYAPLNLNKAPLLFVNRRTSELIKYAANAFLATKITFINEIADLCERVDANVQDVARGIGLDNRIGSKFLHAGPGYGGSCFPKDTVALSRTAQEAGAPVTIVDAVIQANDARKLRMADKIVDVLGGEVSGKTVAVLGLAFKPNTDDMRDAPSLAIIPRLLQAGAHVRAYDPEAMEEAQAKHAAALGGVEYAPDEYACARDADALVILTEWDKFRAMDLRRIRELMRGNALVDLRNIYDPDRMAQAGFRYVGVGRAARLPRT